MAMLFLAPLLPAPITRQTWQLLVAGFQFFPVFSAIQWLTDWYPAGKTSIESKLNIPGKLAWAIMETPGLLAVAWSVCTIPSRENLAVLPWGNRTMAAMYVVHYIYRAWAFPYFQPSMSPIHLVPFLSAVAFNTVNGLCIGGWVSGYGPRTEADWQGAVYRVQIGLVLMVWSLLANMFHDDDLREIRRSAARRRQTKADKEGKPLEDVDKIYMIPKNGLFHFVLYAHYLCEWLEWAGFWMIGGYDCVPARIFLVNLVSTMLPRALAGKRWYVRKFGAEKLAGRKAIIPGIL